MDLPPIVMYIESIPNRSSPPATLLRESCREAGTVKKRTLANLSKPALIEGLRILLKGGTAGLDDASSALFPMSPRCWEP